MSEEIKQEETTPTKQYLLTVDEITMAMLGRVIPGIKYIPIEGMGIAGNATYQLLATPIKPAEVDTKPLEMTESEC